MMNIAGRNSKEKTTPFFLLYGQDVRMGTVAENGNGCGNGCEKNFMKNTWLSENFLISLHRQNQGLKAGRCPNIDSNNFIKPLSNIKNGNNKN